ncbi:MAG: TetR/AcrR family transcriptional regulator [Rhodospirillaceae bacterium]|nr:MAG: TetR/AcrR family transcriptional regulator [Rhodospirillaceae bacterium]
MAEKRERRPRDPEGTREAILEAAGARLAKDGPEGLSLSEVAHLAGVNRGTAYQHFETREKLIKATTEWISDKMFRAVFGDPATIGERRIDQVDPADLTDRLADFAMENPEQCQAWLVQVLSSPNPLSDPFWKEYEGSIEKFVRTPDLAQENIDCEVMSVIMLSGTFLWPIWARAHAKTGKDRRHLARRFTQECLRLSMYGSLRPESYPEVDKRLRDGALPAKRTKPSR